MLIRDPLAQWLGDEAEQARRAARIHDFSSRFRQIPALALLEELLGTANEQPAAGILDLARAFIQDDAAIRACIDEMVDAAAQDPYFQPGVRTASTVVHTGLLLFDGPLLTVMLAVMVPEWLAAKRLDRQGRASISFGGQKSVFRFIRAGGAVLSFWEAPDIAADFSGDPTLRCRLVERRQILDGETVTIDGTRQSFVIEHASSNLVYLQALTPMESSPVMAEFDSETLSFVGASSTDDAGSRIDMMLSLLRVLDRTDAVPLFAEMLESKHFYARWHAMREFLALDAEAALPHLRRMATADPHDEVRTAAAHTLAALFNAQTAPEELVDPCLA
jgi:HEAT repeats